MLPDYAAVVAKASDAGPRPGGGRARRCSRCAVALASLRGVDYYTQWLALDDREC